MNKPRIYWIKLSIYWLTLEYIEWDILNEMTTFRSLVNENLTVWQIYAYIYVFLYASVGLMPCFFWQLEAKLVEMDAINTQLKLSVSNLGLRVKTGNKEMQREMQKVSRDKLSTVTRIGKVESHHQSNNQAAIFITANIINQCCLQLRPSRMWLKGVMH